MTLHIQLANDDSPANHTVEITTQEQVFTPAERYQQYIRVKGIIFQHAGNGFPVPQRGMVSTNRGNHFIFEDDTFEWANSVGLDIGNEDWAASRPPSPVGFDVIRGNTFRYCGIEGLGGTGGPQETLVEKNLFEWIGWQDAAMMSESGGIKMHTARNLMFRNHVVRHIRHGNGIWLDIGNANVRITGNVFADIPGNVNPHAVHIEGSEVLNQIDNNIFSHLTGGILIRDTNNVIAAYNLFMDLAEVCVNTTSGLGAPRPIGATPTTCITLRFTTTCSSSPAALPLNSPILATTPTEMYIRHRPRCSLASAAVALIFGVKFPEPQEWHNLASMREEYGWDKNGAMAAIDASFDPDKLELSLSVKGDLKAGPAYKDIDTDFWGHALSGERLPGPFGDLRTQTGPREVDPR